MNVSSAKRNIPKDIKSLKSNFFISITSILCRMKVNHPCCEKRSLYTIAGSISATTGIIS